MGKDCRTCGHADLSDASCALLSVARGGPVDVGAWTDRYLRADLVTAKKGAPDCPGWTEDDRVTATPEPPEADPKLLALANGELAARVRELEVAVAQKERVIVKMRASLDWSREEGRQEERGAVVAWLRGFDTDTQPSSSALRWSVRGMANCIARGAHRREETS